MEGVREEVIHQLRKTEGMEKGRVFLTSGKYISGTVISTAETVRVADL